MAPPLFNDLGKSARDVFQKGYNYGFVKSDTTTRSGSAELKTHAAHNLTTGNFFGSLDLKYINQKYGTSIIERWNTNNVLSGQITVEDKLVNGAKFIFNSSYAPFVGKSSGGLRGEYKHDKARLNLEVKSNGTGGPLLIGGIVFGHQGWFLGYHTGYEPFGASSKFKQSLMAVGAEKFDIVVHTYANFLEKSFGGNVYHKVSKELELAADVNFTTGNEQSTKFGVGAKYELDKKSTLRTKIDSSSLLALALTYCINQSLKATVSFAVNLQSFYDGNHKIGAGIEFNS